MRQRPVFHPEFGRYLRELRKSKQWTLRQAADIARRHKLSRATRQRLFRLEHGQVKNPEPETLRQVGILYGVSADEIQAKFITSRFGRSSLVTVSMDDALSPTHPTQGGTVGEAPSRRAPEITPPQVQQAAYDLYRIAIECSELADRLLGLGPDDPTSIAPRLAAYLPKPGAARARRRKTTAR